MCELHSYPIVHSDGRRTKYEEKKYCSTGERRGTLCDDTKVFKYPPNERRVSAATTSYYTMPPSPPSSDSSFPLSSNGAERSRRKRSGVYVDVDGTQVINVTRKPSRREKHSNDHIVIVDPPKSASPPRHIITPILKSSSPPKTYQYATPEVRLEVNNTRPSRSGHQRHSSHSSRTSRDSDLSDEERRVRKLKRELEKAEEAVRKQKRIERANEMIANRPAVPAAPNPLNRPYRRPSVSVRRPDQELADAMHQLRVSESTLAEAEKQRRRALRRADERRQAEEDEAQKQRLKDRMTPASQRKANKIMYPDGTYRYEY